MVLDDLDEMQYFADMLAKGIDPTSKLNFSNQDTIMVLPKVISYNKKVYELIDLVKNGKKNRGKISIPFMLTDNNKKKIQLSEEMISISDFCKMINEKVVVCKSMNKLKATQIVSGLVKLGFLINDMYDNKEIKVPTKKGLEIGIQKVSKINSCGDEYFVNLYNKDAQKYIIDNIDDILKTEAV